MRERFQPAIDKARRLRADIREAAERKREVRDQYLSLFREVAEQASRSLRRRRRGDIKHIADR